MSYYRNQLESYLAKLEINADRVLDIGGAANPIQKRVKSFKTNEYICFDLGIEKTKRPYIKFDLNLPLKQLKGYDEDTFKFDCIFCLEVFEYIWNPIEAMSNISKLLGYDGKAIISFPTQYPLHQPKLFDSLRYMKHGIIQLVKHSNLKIKKMFPRKATKGAKALNSFFALEGMHPVKGDNSIYDIGYILEVYKPFQ